MAGKCLICDLPKDDALGEGHDTDECPWGDGIEEGPQEPDESAWDMHVRSIPLTMD